jgi:hypothetical protein
MSNAHALARQAAAQYGLLSLKQVRSHLSETEIRTLIQKGTLQRRRRGLYQLAGHSLSWESDVMAAVLAVPSLALASHRSSMRLWGFRSVDDDVEISIRYPARADLNGVTVHRSRDLSEHDITYIEAIPVTTPARTLCDAGLIFSDQEIERILHHAVAKGVVRVDQLRRYRERVGRQGRNGVCAIDRILDRLPPGIELAGSGPEIRMRALYDEFALPAPVWQHPVVAGGRQYFVDFCYPWQRLAIEYDEFGEHTKHEVFSNDRRRQNDLVAAGWTVIRLVWSDLTDFPAATATRIRKLLVL